MSPEIKVGNLERKSKTGILPIDKFVVNQIWFLCFFGCKPKLKLFFKKLMVGFPDGAVVKNPPANAEDIGPIPGPGRSHMPRSN